MLKVSVSQRCLVLHVYAPALARHDGRPLSAVQALERSMSGLHLMWTISSTGQFVRVEEQERGTVDRTTGQLVLLCNGDEEHLVTVSRMETPAGLNSGGVAQFEVFAEWPMDAAFIALAEDVLESVSTEARAFWGAITPDRTAVEIADQAGLANPLRRLPALRRPQNIRAPEIPLSLGWVNYWSAAAAQAIGFPDPARDAELLSRSRRTEAGGWVVRLTDAPLDLDHPDHLQALLRAYERFPKVGGRAA